MLVVLGVGSLVVHPDFAVGDGVTEEHLFGVFETNGWHGVAGASAGVLAVYSAVRSRWIREVTQVVAVVLSKRVSCAEMAAIRGRSVLGLKW